MFSFLKKSESAPTVVNESGPHETSQHALFQAVTSISQQAGTVGREAAEVRGSIEDTRKVAALQSEALQALVQQLNEVSRAQHSIESKTQESVGAVAQARTAVEAVGGEVGAIVETLRKVNDAARQISQIALQTRLVAFNASVEAKRAGEAGRGFAVVADAVKDLAAKVETSSKHIMGTVQRLDERIARLAGEIQRHGHPSKAEGGAVHQALALVDERVSQIATAAQQSKGLCAGAEAQVQTLSREVSDTARGLDASLARTETLLQVSEHLIEASAACGVVTADTAYIEAVQDAASQISQLLEAALRTGSIGEAELFDEQYRPMPGTNPAQHTTRFVELADRLFPQVQEKLLGLSEKVVYCIAADRNGYIACHNRKYNQPQRPGELTWNTANSRYRRIFNDRTGLASARNRKPFLLQTYRRDMGGGQFIVMKEAAAPIVVNGRHWGGVRLAFKF
jgi:methyl-accepting chemotaxis protein